MRCFTPCIEVSVLACIYTCMCMQVLDLPAPRIILSSQFPTRRRSKTMACYPLLQHMATGVAGSMVRGCEFVFLAEYAGRFVADSCL